MSKIIDAIKNKDFNYLSTLTKNNITSNDIKFLAGKYKNNPWRYYILSINNGDINLLKTAIRLTKTMKHIDFEYIDTININYMDEECIYFLTFNYISKIIKNSENLYSFSKKYGKILLKYNKKIFGSYFFKKIYLEKNIFELDYNFLKKLIKKNNQIMYYLNKNVLRYFYFNCLNDFIKYDYNINKKSKFYFKKMINQYKILFLYNLDINNYLLFREHKIKSINYSSLIYLSLFRRKKCINLMYRKILINYILKL